jgi:hypothetical protein
VTLHQGRERRPGGLVAPDQEPLQELAVGEVADRPDPLQDVELTPEVHARRSARHESGLPVRSRPIVRRGRTPIPSFFGIGYGRVGPPARIGGILIQCIEFPGNIAGRLDGDDMDSRIIRASGFWNLGLAALLAVPPLYRWLGLPISEPVWGWMISGLLLYTSATLILGSRDLRVFGGIILYEGLLRFLGAALLIPAGLFFGYGWLAVIAGVTDLAWGVAFFAIVPARSGLSVGTLLSGSTGRSPEPPLTPPVAG